VFHQADRFIISGVLASASTWILCGIFFTILAVIIAKDIAKLRNLIAGRAKELKEFLES